MLSNLSYNRVIAYEVCLHCREQQFNFITRSAILQQVQTNPTPIFNRINKPHVSKHLKHIERCLSPSKLRGTTLQFTSYPAFHNSNQPPIAYLPTPDLLPLSVSPQTPLTSFRIPHWAIRPRSCTLSIMPCPAR
jgi:hypothetical protein